MSWLLSLILISCSQSAFGVANTDQYDANKELIFENVEAECSVTLQSDRTDWGLGISNIAHPKLEAQEAQQLTDATLVYGDQIPGIGRSLQGSYTFYPEDLLWVDKIVVTTKVDPNTYETLSASFSFIKVNSRFFGFSTEEVEILNCKNATLL